MKPVIKWSGSKTEMEQMVASIRGEEKVDKNEKNQKEKQVEHAQIQNHHQKQ